MAERGASVWRVRERTDQPARERIPSADRFSIVERRTTERTDQPARERIPSADLFSIDIRMAERGASVWRVRERTDQPARERIPSADRFSIVERRTTERTDQPARERIPSADLFSIDIRMAERGASVWRVRERTDQPARERIPSADRFSIVERRTTERTDQPARERIPSADLFSIDIRMAERGASVWRVRERTDQPARERIPSADRFSIDIRMAERGASVWRVRERTDQPARERIPSADRFSIVERRTTERTDQPARERIPSADRLSIDHRIAEPRPRPRPSRERTSTFDDDFDDAHQRMRALALDNDLEQLAGPGIRTNRPRPTFRPIGSVHRRHRVHPRDQVASNTGSATATAEREPMLEAIRRVAAGNGWPRFNAQPPAQMDSGAADAGTVAQRERQRRVKNISKYLETNKTDAPAMSRACGVCYHESPLHRAVFTACGHVVCRACAEKLAHDAIEESKLLTCPFCRKNTGFVPLFENPIG